MPILLEILGFVLFGAATFLFLNARETARENLRQQKAAKAQAERLTTVEMRLRRMEAALYDLATANGVRRPADADVAEEEAGVAAHSRSH